MFALYNVLFCSVILGFESVANNVVNVKYSNITTIQFQTQNTTWRETSKTNLENDDFIEPNERRVSVEDYDEITGDLVKKSNTILESDNKSNTNEWCTGRYSCASNVTNRLCACDSKCIEYKDCCADSEYYEETKMSTPSSYICQEFLYDINRTTHVFVKKDCDPNWKDEDYLNLCTVYDNDYYDIFQQNLYGNIPVTGLTSGITYRNLYCAICNYEKLIRVWNNVTFEKCTFEQTEYTILNKGTMNSTLSLENVDHSIENTGFNGLQWKVHFSGLLYYCVKGNIFIDENVTPMLDGCINIRVEEAVCSKKAQKDCNGTYGLVAASDKDDGTVLYKNKYCAFCDGQTELTCPDRGISYSRALRVKEENQSAKAKARLSLGGPMTYRIVCDMREMTCDTIMTWIPEEGDIDPMSVDICKHVSIVLACIHLLVFAMVPELRTLGDKTIASFFVALVFHYLTNDELTRQRNSCVIIICVYTYSILVVFSWILTMAYDIWKSIRICTSKLRSPANPEKTFWIYTFCNWILTLVPILLFAYLNQYDKDMGLFVDFRGNFHCAIKYANFFYLFCICPVLVIMILAFMFYLHTCYMIFVNSFKSSNPVKNEAIKHAVMFIRLGILSSGFWAILLICLYFKPDSTFLGRLFYVSQGILFFCGFTCKKKNYKGVLKRLRINK